MEATFLLRGFVIGFAIAAPVGPIGILVIRRTLTEGRLIGFLSGLGAATADTFYGSLAAFGLTFLSSILISESLWIRLLGGAFLLYLGLTIFMAKPVERVATAREHGHLGAYTSTVFLTVTNPTTILSFAAVFAGLGLASAHNDYVSALLLILGVFLGSSSWWFALSTGIGLFRQRLTERSIRWVNRISGTILMLFGLGALVSVVSSARRALS